MFCKTVPRLSDLILLYFLLLLCMLYPLGGPSCASLMAQSSQRSLAETQSALEARISSEYLESPKLQSQIERLEQQVSAFEYIEESIETASQILSSYYKKLAMEQRRLYETQGIRLPLSVTGESLLYFPLDQVPQASYQGQQDAINKNLVRLLAQARAERWSRPYFIRDSQPLFRLHTLLARAYAHEEEALRSIAHYNTALRYARPEVDKTRLAKAHRFILQLPINILQQQEGALIQGADPFSQIDVLLARASPRNQFYAQVLYELALQKRFTEERQRVFQTQKIQNKIRRERDKEKKKQSNAPTYSIFQQDEVNLNREKHFNTFSILVELAHRLDPTQIRYTKELSDQYTEIGNFSMASLFTRIFLYSTQQRILMDTTGNARAQVTDELQAYGLRLARLYVEKRNYISASESYEAFLSWEADSDRHRSAQIRKLTADIYFRYTGRLDRAKELYTAYLEYLDSLESQAQEEVLESGLAASPTRRGHTRYTVLRHLAVIAQKQQDREGEEAYLLEARQIYVQQEMELQALEAELRNLQLQVSTTGEVSSSDFENTQANTEDTKAAEELNARIVQKQSEVQKKQAQLQPQQYLRLLEHFAWLSYRKKDWELAKSLFEESLKRSSNHYKNKRMRSQLEIIEARLEEVAQEEARLEETAQEEARLEGAAREEATQEDLGNEVEL